MPRFIFLLSFLFIFTSGHAQYKYKRVMPREANGDTSEWWNWADQWSKHLGIEQLLITDDSLHYRYWTNEQIVEVWMRDDGTKRGKLVSFAKTYHPYDFNSMSQAPSQYYSDFVMLTDSEITCVLALFDSVKSIPTEDSLDGWFQGMDGWSCELETVDGADYSIRHYWSPEVQDTNVAGVKEVEGMVESMRTTLKMRDRYSEFIKTLPPGAYSTDGFMIMTVLTKKQKKKAAKYARKHPSTQ